ncbi:MAG TPA: sigma-70 family RNA polymerase sigma factor [Bryobacteraceae bacterium]|nr:sigma-70 family RNA polymerase sigma factor [Bryobacteraceae bacterium]
MKTRVPEPVSAPEQSPVSPILSDPVDWQGLVERVRRGDDTGMADLYRMFAKGIRFYLCRQLGAQEIDDKIHDTFRIVVKAIRRGDLREPERLMGFVRTVVRRQVAAHIDHLVHRRREHINLDVGARVADDRRNPEQNAAFRQKTALMTDVLRQLSVRDRDVLTRFYLHEQSQEQICDEMRLTETQFRLLKSRAKARFGELGQKKLKKKPMPEIFGRNIQAVAHSGQ